MCFSHSLLILGPAFSAGTSFLEKIINVKLWECTHVWEVRKEDSMMHCLEWVRLDYSLEDTGVFSMSFQAHHNCRFALKETRVRICLWTVRASARQWKITSARCVVTEQQGVDVKIELIAAPAHLLTSAACSPPSRHFPSPRSSEGWLCVRHPYSCGGARSGTRQWCRRRSDRQGWHHTIVLMTYCSQRKQLIPCFTCAEVCEIPRAGRFSGTGGIRARSMKSFGTT